MSKQHLILHSRSTFCGRPPTDRDLRPGERPDGEVCKTCVRSYGVAFGSTSNNPYGTIG